MATETLQMDRDYHVGYSRRLANEKANFDEIPPVVDQARRDSCEFDLHRFLRTYFPQSTGLSPFSTAHESAFARIQISILKGGRFLNLFPRSFAKTTISENSSIWATLYGHRKFIPFFGANAKAARGSLDAIIQELTENPLLLEDFPEICYPFTLLEGKVHRCRYQTYRGEKTHILMSRDSVVFPHIPGAPGADAIVVVRSLKGGVRGLKHHLPDGTQQRPDFVIIDDPQDDEIARSAVQIENLMGTIKRSILRLGGHDREMAVVANATPIEEGDLVSQIMADLAWQSLRVKMLPARSVHEAEFWLGEYAEMRQTYDPEDPMDQARAKRDATALYESKREYADEGAVVTWEHCYAKEEGEISAIQHAYNILIDDGPMAFASECQSEPLSRYEASDFLKNTEIRKKLSGYDRGIVPVESTILTAHVDVQDEALFYLVAAWSEGFSGAVIDYDCFPKQRLQYFNLSTLNPKLSDVYPELGPEGAKSAALDAVFEHILGRQWRRADGALMDVDLLLVDDGNWTQLVHKAISSSKYRSRILPAKGYGEKAADRTPFADYKKKTGELTGGGYPWRIRNSEMTKGLRHVMLETNWWKTFAQNRLLIGKGDPGCLSLYGNDEFEHRLISDHFTSEYRDRETSETTGRTVDRWRAKPGRPDNHWLDDIVGAAVAASVKGIRLAEVLPGEQVRQRKRIKLSDIQARKR